MTQCERGSRLGGKAILNVTTNALILNDRIGSVKTIGCPVKFSETPSAVHSAAPLYAQHTREVMAEFGFGAEEIESLIADGAIIAHVSKS